MVKETFSSRANRSCAKYLLLPGSWEVDGTVKETEVAEMKVDDTVGLMRLVVAYVSAQRPVFGFVELAYTSPEREAPTPAQASCLMNGCHQCPGEGEQAGAAQSANGAFEHKDWAGSRADKENRVGVVSDTRRENTVSTDLLARFYGLDGQGMGCRMSRPGPVVDQRALRLLLGPIDSALAGFGR